MRRTLRLSLLTIICTFAAAPAGAQQWYDLTDTYLQNASFDGDIHYGLDATDNVMNKVTVPDAWALDAGSNTVNAAAAVFQYGTAAMFYSMTIPEASPDGSTTGGCLALAASSKHEVTFYQSVKLPAGNYALVVTSQNRNEGDEGGNSTSGWWVSKTDNQLSECTEFPFGAWKADTIRFTLQETTEGHVQVGFKSHASRVAKSAMLVVDGVLLLRDTPLADADYELLTPVVTTDKRFARGATMAFGRIKDIGGEGITEQGFCYATHPHPTLDDEITTDYLTNNGRIYWIKDLQPSTKYYMRAFAKSKAGMVGYGEDIKFYTIPKGNITYWYNNGGDAAANNRVNSAATRACEIFNDLTCIKKHFNIGYSVGTPTADCYYADEPWMNMGANASYQRTGTIMHEMQHGLGVIPYSTQWNKNILREGLNGDGNGTGHWLGDRVSAFLDFWDNTSGSQLNGDYQHMWPYGINGASEDNGTNELYFANAMIGQALGEDGLEHRYSTFADPCYILDQEDDVKYYLTCESNDYGRYTGFLSADESGKLSWQALTADDAAQDDHAAWYITFTPSNQYYQLRNAATGQYLTYSGSFKTLERSTLTANDHFHLMKGRVNVGSGSKARRGYWLVPPSGDWTPPCLQANANGAVGAPTFNIANSATRQRWIILTAEELGQYTTSGISSPTQSAAESHQQPTGIYSMDGRKLSTPAGELRPGLYIINGRKTIIR